MSYYVLRITIFPLLDTPRSNSYNTKAGYHLRRGCPQNRFSPRPPEFSMQGGFGLHRYAMLSCPVGQLVWSNGVGYPDNF
jgi:hypothetical protein